MSEARKGDLAVWSEVHSYTVQAPGEAPRTEATTDWHVGTVAKATRDGLVVSVLRAGSSAPTPRDRTERSMLLVSAKRVPDLAGLLAAAYTPGPDGRWRFSSLDEVREFVRPYVTTEEP